MRTLLALILLIPFGAFAQVSHSTIYTEEDLAFTVYLNGDQMNDPPASKVRMINLTQPYYSIKIEFDDPEVLPIEKKIFQLTDSKGVRVDATHIIKRTKKGKLVLRWKSHSLRPGYIEDDEPTVVIINNGGSGQVIERTTTTTTVDQTDGVSMSFGGLGGSVRVNTGTAPVEETTTTTTVVSGGGGAVTSDLPCSGTVLGTKDYEAALGSVASRNSDKGKLLSAKQIISSNCLATQQVKDMVELLELEESRLDLAIYAYPYVLDKGSYFKMNSAFSKDESIDVLNEAIVQ